MKEPEHQRSERVMTGNKEEDKQTSVSNFQGENMSKKCLKV